MLKGGENNERYFNNTFSYFVAIQFSVHFSRVNDKFQFKNSFNCNCGSCKLIELIVITYRKKKLCESFLERVRKFPCSDPEYHGLHEDLETIRAKFKQVWVTFHVDSVQ